MKTSIKNTITISALLLLSLRDESVEKTVKLDIDKADIHSEHYEDILQHKAERRYTSIVGMGGIVEIKEIKIKM